MDQTNVTSAYNQSDLTDDDPYKLVANLDRYLWMFFSPFILVLGLTGNILIIFVVRRRKLSGSTTAVYLPSMAVWDSATLITGIIPEWLEAMQIVVFKEISGATCKIDKFLFYTSADTATWILVLFTFDRFIAVCFPLKKRNFCTTKRAKVAVLTSLLLAFVKNLHVFWTRGPVYDQHGNLTSNCGRPEPHTHFELYVRPWIAFTLANAIPFIVILICNIMIIKTIVRVQKMRKDQTNAEKSMMQTVAMCLSASFTFLICITPSMALLIGRPYWTGDDEPNYAYNIAKAINNQLVMVNHSINVVLYCLSGQKFREELVDMLRCTGDSGSPNNSTAQDDKNKQGGDKRGSALDKVSIKNGTGNLGYEKSPHRMSETMVTTVSSAQNEEVIFGNNNHDMQCANSDGLEMADVEIGLKDKKDTGNSVSLKGDVVGQLKSTAEAIVADCIMSVQNQANIDGEGQVTDGMQKRKDQCSGHSVESKLCSDNVTPLHLRGGNLANSGSMVTSSEQDLISRYNNLESTRL